MGGMLFYQWQVVVVLVVDFVGQFGGVEVGFFQDVVLGIGVLVYGVDQDDGFVFVFFQFGYVVVQFVGWDVQCVDDVFVGEFFGWMDIQDYCLVGIDQCGQFVG